MTTGLGQRATWGHPPHPFRKGHRYAHGMGLFSWGREAPALVEPARTELDLGARIEQDRMQRAEADTASIVRGRHYVEWVPTLNEWRTAGLSREDDYLRLTLEVIEAAERAAAVQGVEPAPGYTKRAAIVYRRRKDYRAEVAILRRYIDACPPGRGHDFSERLEKAEQLAEKSEQEN